MFLLLLPALIWLLLWSEGGGFGIFFDGWSFASLFIALIDYFVALLKCIVEITDRAAATLMIHLQELVGLGSLFML